MLGQFVSALLLSLQYDSIFPGKVASEGIYPLRESQTLVEQEVLIATSFSLIPEILVKKINSAVRASPVGSIQSPLKL